MTRVPSAVAVIVACAAFLAAGCVSEAQQSAETKAILSAYLEIHDRLASDTIDGIKAPARQIAGEASKMGEQGGALVNAATATAEAADLSAARNAFGKLSDAVIAATKEQDRAGARIAFCPMAQRSWLQKDPEIRNPYYGSAMLTCGEFREPKK